MADLKLRFQLKISRRSAQYLVCGLLVALCAPELASESVTLTTYYPAPSGIYSQLITTGNAWLARDGGTVTVGNGANATIAGNYALTPNYQSYGSTGSGGATIVNDNNAYKKLIIQGNNSAGGSHEIGLYDNVTVSNNLTVGGNATVTNNLTVSNYASVTQYLDVVGNGGSSTGIGVFRQPGNANCSASVINYGTNNCNGGTAYCCPSGTYITLISGVMTKYQVINDPTNTDGNALCCSCPTGGCPSL